MCGENFNHSVRLRQHPGSSPRVRGKRCASASPTSNLGLIPACAGKTSPGCKRSEVELAHPRVCGENRMLVAHRDLWVGSSPRVRGKHTYENQRWKLERLIPACAGKTCCSASVYCKWWAHPRVCGENVRVHRAWATGPGSSPRVRGKPRKLVRNVVQGRLIPACAGKTYLRKPALEARTAHPRVCGENVRAKRIR